MTYTAKQLFPTWYRSVTPQVTSEVVDLRVNAINDLMKERTPEFWLDVIRLAKGQQAQNNATKVKMVDAFREHDINFELISNDNLIRVLSGILICFKAESGLDDINRQIALALNSLSFYLDFASEEVPFLEWSERCLTVPASTTVAQDQIDSMQSAMDDWEEGDQEEDFDFDSENIMNVGRAIIALTKQNAELSKELNALWWLVGGFSTSNKRFFMEVGVQGMAVASAFELIVMTRSSAEIASARELLYKVLLIANKEKPLKETSVLDTVNAANADHGRTLSQNANKLSEFTPCLLTLHLSASGVDREKTLKARIPAFNPKLKMHPATIAFQFYKELLFLSTL